MDSYTIHTKHYSLSAATEFVVIHRRGNLKALIAKHEDIARAMGGVILKMHPRDDKIAAQLYRDLHALMKRAKSPERTTPVANEDFCYSEVAKPQLPQKVSKLSGRSIDLTEREMRYMIRAAERQVGNTRVRPMPRHPIPLVR